ncbi:MAG: hypothetical protein LBN38_07745 [Verrucomicrobiota bacterium]|nr:hypothetical protein [Verrucomicrobiota bacterium]
MTWKAKWRTTEWGRWLVRRRQAQWEKAMFRKGKRALESLLEQADAPVLTYVVPYDIHRLRTGGGKRIVGVAGGLAGEYAVFILTLAPSSVPFHIRAIGERVWLVSVPQSLAFEAAVKRTSASSAGLAALSQFGSTLSEWVQTLRLVASYTRIWVHVSPMHWGFMEKTLGLAGSRVVYDAHDDALHFWTSVLACRDPDAVNELACRERDLLACAESVFFCTQEDLDAVKKRSSSGLDSHWFVLPNGVSLADIPFIPPSHAMANRRAAGREKPIILFMGTAYGPNYDAVEWLIREAVPRIQDVEWMIVGMSKENYLSCGKQPPPSNMIFTGSVSEEQKTDLFSLAEIAVAPPIPGTGSSLKVPEYVAYGKAIAGAPSGMRGYGEFNVFSSVRVAEDLVPVLQQMLEELKQNPTALDDACLAARRRLDQTWDWMKLVQPLRAALAGAASMHVQS